MDEQIKYNDTIKPESDYVGIACYPKGNGQTRVLIVINDFRVPDFQPCVNLTAEDSRALAFQILDSVGWQGDDEH